MNHIHEFLHGRKSQILENLSLRSLTERLAEVREESSEGTREKSLSAVEFFFEARVFQSELLLLEGDIAMRGRVSAAQADGVSHGVSDGHILHFETVVLLL